MIASKVIYTSIAFLAIYFGITNLRMFKKNIISNLTLKLFYYFSITCLLITLVVCWMPINTWYTITWLFFTGLVHTLEINFAWC